MIHEIKPIDHEEIRAKIASVDEYWDRQPTDQPWSVNGFKGTWAFTDHNLIPDSLRNFIWESFPKHERFRRIPLDEINALMNDVWEGPGSMPKIMRLYRELREARRASGEGQDVKVDGPTTLGKFEDDGPFEPQVTLED
jgi:hypothetical protein